MEEIILRSLLHARTSNISINNNEDDTRMIVDILLRNKRIKRSRQLLIRLIIARQKQHHLLRLSRDILLPLPPSQKNMHNKPMQNNADTHKRLKNGVGAQENEEEVVHLVVLPTNVDESAVDGGETDNETPFLKTKHALGHLFEFLVRIPAEFGFFLHDG